MGLITFFGNCGQEPPAIYRHWGRGCADPHGRRRHLLLHDFQQPEMLESEVETFGSSLGSELALQRAVFTLLSPGVVCFETLPG
jgi:hypothetical protein